ncbi:MAG TPA: POTRA domain-containing protein [Candidatus Acidoferrum sp.]|nr:POTRA domain-containing protein [Candidatus Acidoferrum sp.]
MKLCWANGLRGAVLLMVILGGRHLCGQEPVAGQGANPGPTVRSLRLVRDDGKVLEENLRGLSVKLGEPLRGEEVAASIRTLFQKGNFADVRAEMFPLPDGIRLDFLVRENLFINQVLIRGLKPPPTEASAAASMQLSLGQTYRAADVAEGLERLRETLREEGLYQAKVTADRIPRPETHQLDVIVQVDPGPRARLGTIQLLNNSEFSDAALLRLFRLKPGSELTTARAQAGIGRIRKFLEKKGHLSARVSLRRGDWAEATNLLPLTLEVTEGPQVRVVVDGAKFSRGDLRRLIPIYQEGAVDTDLLEEGKRNLRERLERDGYFDATVEYFVTGNQLNENSDWTGAQETITFRVDRGVRHRLLRIDFSGNRYFSSDLLRGRLTISPSSLFVRPRFSRRLLDSDVLSMRTLYAANGFLAAKVEGKILDNYGGRNGDLVIQFDIEEGKQTLVSSLEIEGIEALSEEQIRSVVGSLPGQPFSDISVASDRDNILALYFNDGFPNATFSWSAEPDPSSAPRADANKDAPGGAKAQDDPKDEGGLPIERAEPMKLVYKIVEGQQIRVRRVLLTGYNHTRPSVIQRQVKVQAGEPLREGDVVETQQKLYNLGVFNRVTVQPQNANGTNPEKDVVVLVEEAKRYTIAYGGGFEVQRLASTTDPTGGEIQGAPRGIFEISKENITGRADSLSLKLRGSTIQGRVLLAYSAPNTLNFTNLSTQATAYLEKTQDINTFSQTRYEGNLQLTDRLTSRSSLLFRYAFRKVTLSNLNIPPQEVPLWNQPTLVSEFSATWFRDTRDNPADATKGSFNTADLSIAGTAIGSSANFVRLFLQNSTYRPITRNWSFARSIRIGILEPYASTVSLTFPAPTQSPLPELIPLPERLYAGGGTSLRGFALNQAGPRDSLSGFPVGGQALVILNQELRFPLRVPYAGTKIGGAIFYDGGNVYSRIDRVTLRWAPPKPVFVSAYPGQPPGRFNPTRCIYNCTNELNYFSHTIGFGLRYATPVGPIRIDLGYEINRAQFVIPCRDGALLCQEGTRLPKLQIFFNLGSSF